MSEQLDKIEVPLAEFTPQDEKALLDSAYPKPLLEKAVLYLSALCDGATASDKVGFSKPDTEWFRPYVQSIQKNNGKIETKLRHRVLNRLGKYSGQLHRVGININDIHQEEAQNVPTTQKINGGEQATQAARLRELTEGWELIKSEGQLYASFLVKGPTGSYRRETHRFSRNGVRAQLVYAFLGEYDRAPSSEALAQVLECLQSKAMYEGQEVPVWIRVAKHEGRLYYDLSNVQGEVVEISPEGWRIVTDPPVRFIRSSHMLAQVTPERNGSINVLRPMVNLANESSWRLLVSWILFGFVSERPHPILLLEGQQGSAKTTLCRVIRELLDPHSVPVRSKPKDLETLAIQNKNNWVVILDNLADGLPDWLSDGLCGLATGSGFGARLHYSNDEEACYNFLRPVMFNGTGGLCGKPDLGDRLCRITQARVTDSKRLDEETFWARFKSLQPNVLGGFFDALVVALRNKDKLSLPALPRMADFCKFVIEAEEALPWERGGFLEAFVEHRAEQIETALEGDPMCQNKVRPLQTSNYSMATKL